MEFHTRGLGSSLACSWQAVAVIRFNSCSNAAHSGHVFRCVLCSGLLPSSTSAKLCCSSTQFIQPSPEFSAILALTAVPTPLPRYVPRVLQFQLCILPRSRFPGLFGSIHLEQVAQFHARLVQLRLAVADRASHQTGNLIMLVTLHIMKNKNRSIAGRQVIYRPLQLQPVYGPGQSHIIRPKVLPWRIVLGALRGLFQRNHRKALLPEMHEHDVYRQTMQPRRKSRLPAKRPNLAVELQECFLRQVFRLSRVRRHSQTKRIHTSLMLVIEHLERFRVPQFGPFNGLSFTGFSVFSLSWLGQLFDFRPHSFGCGISSLCCIVCVRAPNVRCIPLVPEY